LNIKVDYLLQVTGEMQEHLSSWDVLRSALPVGTVSGAPKVCGSLSLRWFWL